MLKNVIAELIEIHWSLTGNVDTDQFSRWWKQWIMDNEPKDHSISQVFAQSMYDEISMTLSVIGVDELAKPEKSVKALEDLILLVINELKNLGEDVSNHENFSVRLIIPVGHNLLWEISKLRALRILIAHIAYAFDLKERCFIIETTEGKTIASLGTNDHKIANPVIALACIAGEADAICLPVAEGVEPDKESFHRRIARNVHHLMVNESGLDKVIDPTAGSYFFEELTNNLAKTCWHEVQQKISEV